MWLVCENGLDRKENTRGWTPDIDGKQGRRTFDNINPATEEVLGPVADGSCERHGAARSAQRVVRSTPRAGRLTGYRARCLAQLQAAMEAEQEDLRSELVAEVRLSLLLGGTDRNSMHPYARRFDGRWR